MWRGSWESEIFSQNILSFILHVPESQFFYLFSFYFQTDSGIRNLSADEAARLSGSDPDYAIRDLYNAISSGDYVSL